MGKNWKMVLLSTLAALVILVHSEEEMELEYHREVGARDGDRSPAAGAAAPTSSIEQTWRAIEVDPIAQHSHQLEMWDEASPEEAPRRRRRPGRKQKRRPQTDLREKVEEKRMTYDDDIRNPPYHPDTNSPMTDAEPPRRRRKRPEMTENRWSEEPPENERPMRRRGQRRKRPNPNKQRPKQSEFDVQPEEHAFIENEPPKFEEPYKSYDHHDADDSGLYKDLPSDPPKDVYENRYVDEGSEDVHDLNNKHDEPIEDETFVKHMKEDKSLSEFSAESSLPIPANRYENFNAYKDGSDRSIADTVKKAKEKYVPRIIDTKYFPIDTNILAKSLEKMQQNSLLNHMPKNSEDDEDYERMKAKKYQERVKTTSTTQPIRVDDTVSLFALGDFNASNGPIDPQTLKEILKRSNGTSLSEVLQQHNLSLTDLLRGRENAISVLTTEENITTKKSNFNNEESTKPNLEKEDHKTLERDNEEANDAFLPDKNSEMNQKEESTVTPINVEPFTTAVIKEKSPEILDTNEDAPKIMTRRRLPPSGRRKLRLKTPMRNNTAKFPVTRDFTALNTRRQALQKKFNESAKAIENAHRNGNKSNVKNNSNSTTTTTELTTTQETTENNLIPNEVTFSIPSAPSVTTENIEDFVFKSKDPETTPISTTESEKEVTTIEMKTEAVTIAATTDKPNVTPIIKEKALNNSELRRQALTNRLKRKRLKQKNSTTESPQEDVNITKDLFGMPNLVPASEFIAKMQSPKTTKSEISPEISNSLDETLVTEASSRVEKSHRMTIPYTITKTASTRASTFITTTEETAKIEIEEILNDRSSGARLSKILKERNMTFDELVNHRERGSSQVHLADIFHNASREPDPTEPFLSKSSIEPISKETYPLRALLEANLHDPTVKPSTMDMSSTQTQHFTIPIVMDFRNNVNENGENLGIVSLFNKLTNNDINTADPHLDRDSEGIPYISSVTRVDVSNTTENNREGRVLGSSQDMVTLNDIFSLIQNRLHNESTSASETEYTKALSPEATTKKVSLEEDLDGDGLIVLEDLQHLKDFESNIAPEERLDIGLYDDQKGSVKPGILDKIPSNTKSVTVATASIVGLTMVVFLLTYAAFKWRQQRNMLRKKDSFSEERIPTPVFESRKGKNNSSSRSISPMLPSSNIYTMSTLDSRNGKESPDYMWDSLRKPFQ